MCSFLSVFTLIALANAEMKLTLFDEGTTGGQCLDGSPAGFYYQAPPSGSSNLWIIELEGGGACYTESKCSQRAHSHLGSSNYWNSTINVGGALSNDPSINPDFYAGHKVYCPYCSSDCWSGQRTVPATDPNTWGFYFSGNLVFENIIQYLFEYLSFLDAEYVLLTGPSAGGLGTFGNTDWLYNQLKQKSNYKNNITFKAAPKAGWFYPGNCTDEQNDPMMPPNDYPHWTQNKDGGAGHNDSGLILWDTYLNPKCVNDLGSNLSWHCGSIHNLYKYIETPLFVMENKYDEHQIVNGFLLPTNVVNSTTIGYVEYFGNDMDRSILTQMIDIKNNKNGLFYASCFDHTPGLGIGNDQKLTKINNYNSSELVGDWFWERNKLPHFVYDTCNNDTNQLPCNPTCHTYPPN